MELHIYDNSVELGRNAAECIAKKLNEAIAEKGKARMILSTGASQFDMFRYLVDQDVDWKNVEMFHLDEYIGLSESHPASFRKYLRDRFTNIVPVTPHFVNTEGDIGANLKALTGELRKEAIDVGVIGIGENGHIAFNDPPADFDTREAYKVVDLDKKCRMQQVGEGWFSSLEDTPAQAVSMTPYQIMQCRCIVSVVPDGRKAEAIRKTLENEGVSNEIPATLLKEHKEWYLYLDRESAAGFLAVC
ncbi:glucosamine-6-phosphate deaminase [Clostridium sp. AF18-27]|uniref:glucosamine-6-phosphate deaminase n=1 Tax=Enterocloster lavalensis TaxID=460384 RepID=UPI000E54995C|nr:glucosamine-6-phosphate deaminase [Enterocloster lavalensis]RHR47844.1 glucosamine-6-phosphate deaminase [Clostridium sp. AF18-27]